MPPIIVARSGNNTQRAEPGIRRLPTRNDTIRSGRVYVICSVLVAFIAIIAPSSHNNSNKMGRIIIDPSSTDDGFHTVGDHIHPISNTDSAAGFDDRSPNNEMKLKRSPLEPLEKPNPFKFIQDIIKNLQKHGVKAPTEEEPTTTKREENVIEYHVRNNRFFSWSILRRNTNSVLLKRNKVKVEKTPKSYFRTQIMTLVVSLLDTIQMVFQRVMQFIRTYTSSSTLTQIMDKILTSTPRLLALANLLLAVTYLLHATVATLFLGNEFFTDEMIRTNLRSSSPTAAGTSNFGASTSNRMHRSGRERLGGYLLFKLLLISAVVEPDTLDLLILLSWYTVLSFLRSLAHLAAMTVAHSQASGQHPPKGVLQLLLAVLICDVVAACVCAALFHGAGIGMVLLLNCDCALLAVDIVAHIVRYSQHLLEEKHNVKVTDIEARQLQLHNDIRALRTRQTDSENSVDDDLTRTASLVSEEETRLREESRKLDQALELLEANHTRRMNSLEYMAYIFELLALLLSVFHFLHIWSLHGVSFNLVDGVLALHLQGAIAAIGKKIAQRRNQNRIARDLDGLFDDASEVDMRKASISGDVCCICLGTMTTGNVKKVGCGHLYHTTCLREVVERARSIDLAKCPLCRSSILRGSSRVPNSAPSATRQGFPERPNNEVNIVARLGPEDSNTNTDGIAPQAPTNQVENSLFRFSTEGLLPGWLPLPAFSFEVVRRPGAENTVQPHQRDPVIPRGNIIGQQQQHQELSLFRRTLLVLGLVQFSPEEEAAAIGQLVDMFPQYERADLLRELRNRGSSEAVVELVLSGAFLGVDRQGAINMASPFVR